jgi:uncharacterized protein (TIGR02453 family)
MLHPQTLLFLQELAENNNREWFQENRKLYDSIRASLETLVGELIVEVGKLEDLGTTKVKDCIFRINRDIRFSKDKAPYKRHLAAAIGPGGRQSGRIDYYLHIQPGGESMLGAGMWNPTSVQLAKYRQEIDYNAAELKAIIEQAEFRNYFPEAWGESMKAAPKGYAKDHPEIELLRRKQLFFMHKFTDEEVTSRDFVRLIMEGIVVLKPYCDFLNYIFFDEDSMAE